MPDFRSIRPVDVGVACALGAAVWLVVTWLSTRRSSSRKRIPPVPKQWEPVGKVQRLVVYPLKSCKGRKVDSVVVNKWAMGEGPNVDR